MVVSCVPIATRITSALVDRHAAQASTTRSSERKRNARRVVSAPLERFMSRGSRFYGFDRDRRGFSDLGVRVGKEGAEGLHGSCRTQLAEGEGRRSAEVGHIAPQEVDKSR